MKRILTIFFITTCLILAACGKGQTVNGHTLNTAYRSVKFMKEKIPPESRVEFEVSFWTIRDANKSNEEFLNVVDGKSAFQIIEIGKEIYQQRKSSGFKDYEKYNSWEEMIAKFEKERMDQEKTHTKGEKNFDSKNYSVLYNLRGRVR
jgi:hypothetical protein